MSSGRTLVIGAGIAGMSAARTLTAAGQNVVVAEAQPMEGGLARGCGEGKFIHDLGPHYFFSSLAEKAGIADRCPRVPHREEVILAGRAHRFPFGLLRRHDFLWGACRARLRSGRGHAESSLADFLTNIYGAAFRDLFAAPLFLKWTGFPVEELSASYRKRLLPPSLRYLLHSFWQKLHRSTEDYFRAGRFFVYPPGGMAEFCTALKAQSSAEYRFGQRLVGLETEADKVLCARFESAGNTLAISADTFLSTIPLPRLAALLPGSPWDLYRPLPMRHLRVLFFTVDRRRVLDSQWQWFPEAHYPFYRIGENKGIIPGLAPPGQTLLTVELAYNGQESNGSEPLHRLQQTIALHLKALYGVRGNEISAVREAFAEDAYPILLRHHDALTAAISHETPLVNLFLAGRGARFRYLMMEEAFDDGQLGACLLLSAWSGRTPPPAAG